MKNLLVLLLIFFSCQFSFAADDGDWWLQRQIQIGDGKNQYGKKVYGKAARAVMESVPIKDSTLEEVRQLIKRSIAVDKPTPSKVGGSMLKRVNHYVKVPGIQMIGVLAVTQLLEGIGWILEDGGYVKKIEKDPDYDPRYLWAGSFNGKTQYFPVPREACLYSMKPWPELTINKIELIYNGESANCYHNYGYTQSNRVPDPNYDPNKPKEFQTVPLTAALLGAAMLGTGYVDPDPKFDNTRVNTGGDTGVKEIYEQDPSGVGNELADAMDDKLKNAKPTDDAKPSWIGDPKYDDRPLIDDRDDSSDRSWDEKGDESTGGIEPTKDPETGEATGGQSISLQFPLFCSWASKMCQWYDDWKQSDKIHQKFEEDVKNHQSDEKSFWQTVKDWFDWTKEEPEDEPEPEQPEVNDQGIFSKTFDTTFSLSKECPPDIPISFESTYLTGSYTFSMNWLCIIFSFMAYPLVFLSHCIGIWILYEAATRKEIKW